MLGSLYMEASGIEYFEETEEVWLLGRFADGTYGLVYGPLQTLTHPDEHEHFIPLERPPSLSSWLTSLGTLERVATYSLTYDSARDIWWAVGRPDVGRELWAWDRQGAFVQRVVLGDDIEGNVLALTYQEDNLFWIGTSAGFYQLALSPPAAARPVVWTIYE
ncbi:MAG: hypothetical protein KF858_06490 [Candidatus Sumerlaeia bacterium]|nr:hypothetical protein [Candidatus Sumerlaeia bacterium]